MEYVASKNADSLDVTEARNSSEAPRRAYGTTRNRRRTFTYEQIESAASALMAAGDRPSVEAVRKAIGRGSTNHIASDLRKFWKKQSALQVGVPAALAFLPPEMADAAHAQWEKALLLAQQVAKCENNEARARLEQLKRETELRSRTVDLREKEWRQIISDQEGALEQTREMINQLVQSLDLERELRYSQESHVTQLESQIQGYRRQLATLIAGAISKHQAMNGRPRPQARLPPQKNAIGKKQPRSHRNKLKG